MSSKINRFINQLRQYNNGFDVAISEYQQKDKEERVDFFLRIRDEYLTGFSGRRLKEDTKKRFLQMVYPDQDVSSELKVCSRFAPIESLQIGETYLSTYFSETTGGAAYRMKLVAPKESSPSQIERKSVSPALTMISNLINEIIKEKKFFVAKSHLFNCEPVVFDAFDVYVDNIKVKGRSHELPMAMALLSIIFKKPLPANVAFTGELNEFGKIERVSGLTEKIKAIMNEYPEVDTLYIPKQNEFDKYFRPNNIKIVPVDRFSDLMKIIYPDFSEIIEGDIEEKIYFEVVKDVELSLPNDMPRKMETPKAVLFTLRYSYVGDLGTGVMNKLNLVDEIRKNTSGDSDWFILDNVRPNWYVAFLAGKFFNKCSVFAITSKSDGFQHAVVIFKRGDVGVKPGDKIPYTIKKDSDT